MKKVLAFAALAATLVSFASCQKEENKKPNRVDEDENTYVSPITVDGNFADWDALDASKVAVATCAEGRTELAALKTIKVYCDEVYLNVYLEFDPAQVDPKSETALPTHIYLNADNNSATGGYGVGENLADANAEWIEGDAEFMLEASLLAWDGSGTVQSYDPSLFKWYGEVGTSGWDWTDPNIEPNDDNLWGAILAGGVGSGAGSVTDGKYEIQITKELLTGVSFADTFTLGVDIQQNWNSIGWLPNAPVTEDNPRGYTSKLVVTVDK